ncbi:hypothetical protein G6F24_016274 [Rhizopus arrhizus]|nr:hypothetical protein G6F24_016274 [Rhizopus arrhizus]
MKNRPTMLPTKVPQSAFRLAPTRCAPTTVASTSTSSESRVSTPSTTRVGQPTWTKPSAQAASSSPMNTSGMPGRAGRMIPAMPTRTKMTASRYKMNESPMLSRMVVDVGLTVKDFASCFFVLGGLSCSR